MLANCCQSARAPTSPDRNVVVVEDCFSQCALRLFPYIPPTRFLVNGKSEVCCHAHFGVQCIQMLLLCLLAGKLSPGPAGKRNL